MDPELFFDRVFPWFPWFAAVTVVVNAVMLLTAIQRRRARGQPILSNAVPGAVFIEQGASGHSHRAWYSQFGGASRVLIVAVTPTHVVIRPRFPFNLIMMPPALRLEFDVPLSRVVRVDAGSGGAVDLHFHDEDLQPTHVTLHLKDPAAFVSASRGGLK